MDCIAHGVAKSWTRLSDFHFHLAGFPSGLVGKESACNAGDPGLIPGLCSSPGEGIGYPLQYSWASLVAQLVKNSPAVFDPWIGKIPGRRKRLPTSVFWPGEFHGLSQRIGNEGNGTPFQYSCLANPMDGGAWWAAAHRVATSRTRLSDFTFTFHFHALEKEMATHSVLAWRIPGMGEPGGLLSMGLHRVGHD